MKCFDCEGGEEMLNRGLDAKHHQEYSIASPDSVSLSGLTVYSWMSVLGSHVGGKKRDWSRARDRNIERVKA